MQAKSYPRYIFNSAVRIYPLNSRTEQQLVLCEVPAQGETLLRYAIPADLIELLKKFDGKKPVDEVLGAWISQGASRNYTREALNDLIKQFYVPKGMLYERSRGPALPCAPEGRKYLYFRARLFAHSVVYPVAKSLGWLFRMPVFIFLAFLIVAVHVYIYSILSAYHLNINGLRGSPLLWVTFITILAAIFHEFGHASALARNGCKRLEIGMGLYLRFPVLYTDVSEAWRLPPHQRVLVDLGGLYFQNICVLVLSLIFFLNRSVTLLYMIVLVDLSMVFSMNPFLRMDGYWFVADYFGIFDLREQSISLLNFGWGKIRGNHLSKPRFLELKKTSLIVLCGYTILSSLFFIYLTLVVTYQTAFYLLPAYPHIWSSLWRSLTKDLSFVNVTAGILEIAWKTAILTGCLQFIWRFFKGTLQHIRKHVFSTREYVQVPQSPLERPDSRQWL